MSLCVASVAVSPSFTDFDRRAKKGERLTVAFFGASLTWGANATDQTNTSYRAVMADYLEAKYPKAHFKFYDAAIGGTGSQLGVFRLDRDVLRRKPDLVFLDFAANDDIYSDNPESLASYESLVRRIIVDGKAPVVLMIFPFGWNVTKPELDTMKRRTAILQLAQDYHAPVGDAISLAIDRVKAGTITVPEIWPNDQVHPGDVGYKLFADAGWTAYQAAVKHKVTCAVPAKMRYSDKYLKYRRVNMSTLGAMPEGWRIGTPSLVAAWHDGLMSRWLDDVVIATNRTTVVKADGKRETVPQTCGRIKAIINAQTVMFFGEEGVNAGKYRVYIDGKAVTYTPWGAKEPTDLYSAGFVAGTRQHAMVITNDLDASTDHLLEIEPVFEADKAQELRLESICVAGGKAEVRPVPAK